MNTCSCLVKDSNLCHLASENKVDLSKKTSWPRIFNIFCQIRVSDEFMNLVDIRFAKICHAAVRLAWYGQNSQKGLSVVRVLVIYFRQQLIGIIKSFFEVTNGQREKYSKKRTVKTIKTI